MKKIKNKILDQCNVDILKTNARLGLLMSKGRKPIIFFSSFYT